MNRRIVQVAAIAVAVAFSVMVLTSPSPSPPIPLPEPGDIASEPAGVRSAEPPAVSILATGLEKPRAIAVHGDRVFVTEKGGAIRVIQGGTPLGQPLAVFRAADAFDAGLLGIAVHPDFEENHYLYVFLTYEVTAATTTEGGEDAPPDNDILRPAVLQSKIVRITESGNRLQDAVDILDGIPGSQFTNGGFVKFGPDGKLYVGTGTTSGAPHLPQDPGSLAGKILRINDDGSIPQDNPFGGDSAVYSVGHRNPQGMAWDDRGVMYAAEHGPEKNDEINVIVPGANYGWPGTECSAGGADGAGGTVLCYDPSIEPGGIAFYGRDQLGIDQPFVMTSLRASNLYQIDFEEGLPSQQPILSGVGRIRDAVVHPDDGSIYVITSNTDGKGFPGADDDRLLRIRR